MRSILYTIFLITGSICLFSDSVHAQSYSSRMKELQRSLNSAHAIQIGMNVRVFANDKTTQPAFEQNAQVEREASNYHYRLGLMEVMMNEHYIIMADHSSREIMFSPRSLDEENKYKEVLKLSLDSILQAHGTPKYIQEKNGYEHFQLVQENNPVSQIDIFIDPVDVALKEVQYRYKDGHFVTIKFTAFNMQPHFAADTFNDRRYFIKGKNKLTSASDFVGYQVMEVKDQTTKKNKR